MKAFILVVAFLVAAIVAFLAFGAYLSSTPDGKERIASREAIAECRKGEHDELQELSTRRMIREVCDKMESDYVQKWGRSP